MASTPSRSTREERRGTHRATGRRWSQKVTETSDALDLEPGVFKGSARAIAIALKRSADRSRRRKADPFRSAMSMLTFYVNRAGKGLSAERRRILDAAKDELRRAFGRPPRVSRVKAPRTKRPAVAARRRVSPGRGARK
jgi:hypothetical protein